MSGEDRKGPDEVGGVGEEAAKLLDALDDWAKKSGANRARTAASAAEGLLAGLRNVDQHVATGSAACTYCPVCQAISLVRSTSPEVRTHLTSAMTSLLAAASGLLETRVPSHEDGPARVTKIDLDDESSDEAPDEAPPRRRDGGPSSAG